MTTITVKINEDLKQKMKQLDINWSQYVREAIRERIRRESQKKAIEQLLTHQKRTAIKVPKGFINTTLREMREAE